MEGWVSDGEAERAADHAAGDVRQWLIDLKTCLLFLTRLPVSAGPGPAPRLASASRAFGLAGTVVGAIAAIAYAALHALGVPSVVAVGAMLALLLVLTGALHEDGLADTADGFGGGASPTHRLAIMRDSHIGSFGVLALLMAMGLRWAALAHVAAAAEAAGRGWLLAGVVIAAAALSRAFMVEMLHALPPARLEGRSAEAGRPGRSTVSQARLAGLLVLVVALWPVASWWAILLIALAGAAGLMATVSLARRLIGGQTGDVVGATQVASEVAILIAASAFAA
jgi:adenosylcobinamide-GDP ribazoletransferase